MLSSKIKVFHDPWDVFFTLIHGIDIWPKKWVNYVRLKSQHPCIMWCIKELCQINQHGTPYYMPIESRLFYLTASRARWLSCPAAVLLITLTAAAQSIVTFCLTFHGVRDAIVLNDRRAQLRSDINQASTSCANGTYWYAKTSTHLGL